MEHNPSLVARRFNILMDMRTGGSSTSVTIYTSASTLEFYAAGSARITGPSLNTGQWYHIAVVRESGSTRMFVDGSQVGVTYTDSNNYIQNKCALGCDSYAFVQSINGWIDMFRINNGVALYNTSSLNFTPPHDAPGELIV
jgi:hypothetical protein